MTATENYIVPNIKPGLQGFRELLTEFNSNLKRFFENKFNLPFLFLGEPTVFLKKCGLSDGKIILRSSVLSKKIDKHGLLYEDLEDLPQLLRKPLFVFQSKTRKDTLIFILDKGIENGLLFASIVPNRKFDTYNLIEVNDITSLYDKSLTSILDWLNNGFLNFADLKRIRACFTRLQLPAAQQTLINSASKVIQKNGFVNSEYKKNKKNMSHLGSVQVLNSNQYGLEAFYPTYQERNDYSNLIALGSLKMYSKGTGDLDKVLAAIKEIIFKYSWQVKKLAAELKADTLEQSAFNVWHFMRRIEAGGNLNYALDTKGKEELRTPARTWHDRKAGVDCDDMAIFSAALLRNMGYNPELHIVAFNGKEQFGHIYTVVGGIVVDGVMKRFDKHPEGITKTKIMSLQIEVLDGLSEVPENILLGIEANEIDSTTDFLMQEQSRLIALAKEQGLTPQLKREIRKIRALIAMNGMRERDVLLDVMPVVSDISGNGEMLFINEELRGIAGDYLANLVDIEEGVFSGLGATEADLELEAKEKYYDEMLGYLDSEQELAGLGDLGRKRRLKNFFKKAKAKIKKVAKKVGGATKKVGKFVKKTAKKVGQAIMKFSPVTIAVRSAFRGLIALNFMGLASKMYIGTLNYGEAAKLGYSISEWKKFQSSWNKTVKIFEKGGGSKSKLLKSVKNGQKRKALFNKSAQAKLSGLGSVVAVISSVGASLPLLKPITDFFGDTELLQKLKSSKVFQSAKKTIKNYKSNAKTKATSKGATTDEEVSFIEDNELDPTDSGNSKTIFYVVGGIAALGLIYMAVKK